LDKSDDSQSPDCAANFEDVGLAAGLDEVNPPGLLYLTELMQLGHKPSEDCLTLNIWTKPQSGEKAKAVLFWIYGGGFNSGNSANKAYDGQWLADNQDVVVVSIK
jgi:cholinesterase